MPFDHKLQVSAEYETIYLHGLTSFQQKENLFTVFAKAHMKVHEE